MGKRVAEVVGKSLGRTILELGGNNAIIATKNADLDLVTRAVLFGAVGTAGQRCTSTRRLYLAREIFDDVTARLQSAYRQVKIGDPLDEATLMGPLINEQAVEQMLSAVEKIGEQGGEVIAGGGRHSEGVPRGGHYVQPTLVKCERDLPLMQDETFAPILYLVPFDSLDEVIERHNDVPQGLSSAIFTTDLPEAEQFLSAAGSELGCTDQVRFQSGICLSA